jgi:hypothetical protein
MWPAPITRIYFRRSELVKKVLIESDAGQTAFEEIANWRASAPPRPRSRRPRAPSGVPCGRGFALRFVSPVLPSPSACAFPFPTDDSLSAKLFAKRRGSSTLTHDGLLPPSRSAKGRSHSTKKASVGRCERTIVGRRFCAHVRAPPLESPSIAILRYGHSRSGATLHV